MGDNQIQTHAVGADEHKSRAGSRAVEYISRFQVTSYAFASRHQFDIYLGKGPHTASNSADFLTTPYQKPDSAYPGLISKDNKSMLDWIKMQSGDRPAIMIGDWNNELTTQAVDNAHLSAAQAQMFHNQYNYKLQDGSHILDKVHPGSNAEDLLVGTGAAYSTGKDIDKVNVDGQTWASLQHGGKVNTQVLSFSALPVTVDAPKIRYDVYRYGDNTIQVNPDANPYA
jgi:hypothetical protein